MNFLLETGINGLMAILRYNSCQLILTFLIKTCAKTILRSLSFCGVPSRGKHGAMRNPERGEAESKDSGPLFLLMVLTKSVNIRPGPTSINKSHLSETDSISLMKLTGSKTCFEKYSLKLTWFSIRTPSMHE